MASSKRIRLSGSDRQAIAGFRSVGPIGPTEQVEITITLKPKAPIPLNRSPIRTLAGSREAAQSREEVRHQCGASAESLKRVEEFASTYNLRVLQSDAIKRSVVLSGTAKDLGAAFGVSLERFENGTTWYRGRIGSLEIPEQLKDDIESVLGLDNRPQAKPHFRRKKPAAGIRQLQTSKSYSPTELAQLYKFPTSQNGAGQCIALIELGGGYLDSDLQTYFQQLGMAVPGVVSVAVDGANNSPTGSADGPDGEVALDIEVAGAVAPGSTIAVYFAPNTDRGFLDAVNAAIHDQQNKPSVISISWGGPESSWTAQAMQAFDTAFQTAGAMGITVCAASGDDGSTDGVSDNQSHVDFPSSSPHALACGGTRLDGSGNSITSETVWNDGPGQGATGGGFSATFPTADWQTAVNTQKFRGVPDVAGDADPETGYQVFVDGNQEVFGGTSAVAPLWAGLVARLNQALGTPVGYFHPILYGGLPSALNDITSGNNGAWKAAQGWDPCTGLGSPDGQKILSTLQSQ
ncbi:MAG TPA: S53 family peptidase [Candidatus Saccharimonadales bacterium]|nr:S53 family peptidase [Candidatus Saccharimonadales bacterium]